MEKKNLDKLFQEKLSSFSEAPEERVWDSIEASLDKKKKSRIVPIWWKLGGVAALLAVLFLVFNPLKTDIHSSGIKITDVEDPTNLDNQTNDSLNMNPYVTIDKNGETIQVTEVDSNTGNVNDPQQKIINDLPSTKGDKRNLDQGAERITANQLAKNDADSESKEKNKAKSTLKIDATNKTEAIVLTNPKKDPSGLDRKEEAIENNAIAINGKNQKSNGIDAKEKEGKSINKDPELPLLKQEEAITAVEENQKGKKSIFDAIEELETNDKEQPKESQANRWAMGPSVAPVYFDAVGQGSPIHSNFARNSKSGNLNLSYGLTVSYDISKKLSVRSGVHMVDYGYDTNEVVFSSSLTASTNELIDNINYSTASRSLVVESKSTSNTFANDSPTAVSEFSGISNSFEGSMVQQMGYLEVPFELNYALLDKKVGVNIIGGVSSLFLIDNSVSLVSDGLVTDVGEANNINDVNFSTNIGLGFNYEFAPNLQLNLEPIFKYQLNTFSETAGQFRPYTLGIYSGISFKF